MLPFLSFVLSQKERKMETNEEGSWSSLPSEIQSIILEYLPVTSLIVCSAVSKEWYALQLLFNDNKIHL